MIIFGLSKLFRRKHDAEDQTQEKKIDARRAPATELSDSQLVQEFQRCAVSFNSSRKNLAKLEERGRNDGWSSELHETNTRVFRMNVEGLPRRMNKLVEEMQSRLEQDGLSEHRDFDDMVNRLGGLSGSELTNPDALSHAIRSEQPITNPLQKFTM